MQSIGLESYKYLKDSGFKVNDALTSLLLKQDVATKPKDMVNNSLITTLMKLEIPVDIAQSSRPRFNNGFCQFIMYMFIYQILIECQLLIIV